MKTKSGKWLTTLALLAIIALNAQLSNVRAQGTAFTYQGQLQNNGGPANGSYDLTFTLFNVSSGGIGSFGPLTNSAMAVTNGLLTTTLDFGSSVFGGTSWWLQIGVRTNGGASFAALTPRQKVTPTPYAIYSSGAGAATSATTATIANGVSAGSVTGAGIASGQVVKSLNGLADAITLSAGANVTITPSGNTLTVASTGGGGSGWSLTGNAGTTPGTDFLGTSDNEPLELWVNDARALRLEPGNGSPNVIGGSGSSADLSVGGGTIAGGIQNTLSNNYPTVSGGAYNHATANGAVVGGGYNNTASGREATVGGGAQNVASGVGAFVGGGGYDGTTLSHNAAVTPAATVGGGLQNFASGSYATVGGGSTNTASGLDSTIPGGYFNTAFGSYSFAAGFGAQAQHTGAFVWADDSGGFFYSTADNQFSVRADGGVRIVTGGSGLTGMTLDGYQVLTTASGGGGGGGGITNGWLLTGNSGANPENGYFLGTTDTNGLELHVAGSRGLRLDYASQSLGAGQFLAGINVNGGYFGNVISNGIIGGTIAGGGGQQGTLFSPTIFPNTVTGDFGTVGGGDGNVAGYGGTVPGGINNAAVGNGSFAAGNNAAANDNDSFVWGDGTRAAASQGADTFSILATGGIYFYTTSAGTHVVLDNTGDIDFGSQTRQMLNLYGSTYGIGVQSSTVYQRTAAGGGFAWFAGGVHNDGQDNPGGGATVMTLDGTGNLNVAANASVCSLSIRGGCDLAEPFQISSTQQGISEGAVVVIDEENPGHLKLSEQPYDARVAGIISGANGINPGIQMQQQGIFEGGENVALSGRVYVQADASNGPIKPGDLLTSSTIPGHAMRVSDHARAQGAILAACRT